MSANTRPSNFPVLFLFEYRRSAMHSAQWLLANVQTDAAAKATADEQSFG